LSNKLEKILSVDRTDNDIDNLDNDKDNESNFNQNKTKNENFVQIKGLNQHNVIEEPKNNVRYNSNIN